MKPLCTAGALRPGDRGCESGSVLRSEALVAPKAVYARGEATA